MISPAGELRVCEWVLRFPSYVGREVLFSLTLSQVQTHELHYCKLGRSWESSIETHGRHQRESDPTVSQTPPRGPPQSTGHPSPTGSHDQSMDTRALHIPSTLGWLPECTPYGGGPKFWKMPSEHMKSWSKSAGQGEISNFSFISALGKAREKLSAPGWVHGKTDKKAYKIKA